MVSIRWHYRTRSLRNIELHVTASSLLIFMPGSITRKITRFDSDRQDLGHNPLTLEEPRNRQYNATNFKKQSMKYFDKYIVTTM